MLAALPANPCRRAYRLQRIALIGLVAAGLMLAASLVHHTHWLGQVQALTAVDQPLSETSPYPLVASSDSVHSAHSQSHASHSTPAEHLTSHCPLCMTLSPWGMSTPHNLVVPPPLHITRETMATLEPLSFWTQRHASALHPRAPPVPTPTLNA